MTSVNGWYSGSHYDYYEENGKWILERTPCGMDEVTTEIYDTKEEVSDRIQEVESWFDHRSPWD